MKMNTKTFFKITRKLSDWAPTLGLILTIVIFYILTEGKLLTFDNVQSLTNQVIITALVAIGAVFVFGMGSFDMSLGSSVLIAAVLGGKVAIATGNLFWTLLLCLAIPLVMGWLKGLFASRVKVPFFIFTIVLSTLISSLVLVIMGDESTIYLKDAVPVIPTLPAATMFLINILALGLYLVMSIYLFNYTGTGIRVKTVGGNPQTARQSGMNLEKIRTASFLISAIGIGLAAFLLLIRVRTVGTTTASSLGTDVLVALVLGGMPISGGPKSKISAGIVGAATITILNSGLIIIGLSNGVIQAIRGIVFLIVVLIASQSYRTKLLPR